MTAGNDERIFSAVIFPRNSRSFALVKALAVRKPREGTLQEHADDAISSFNLIGAEDNILTTARPGEGDAVDFYTYNGIYAL